MNGDPPKTASRQKGAKNGARRSLRKPVGDKDAELTGEGVQEAYALAAFRVLGVPVDGL